MTNRGPIVCPIDESPTSTAAATFAFALARQQDVEVHLLQVLPRPRAVRWEIDVARDHPTAARLQPSAGLAALRRSAGELGVRTRVVTEHGRAPEVILAHAQLQEARLLVISQDYGRTGFLRSWPVAQRVARHSPSPVLVVPTERPAGGDASGVFIEILCAIDFSVASAIAMRQALDLSRHSGGRVTLLHVLESVPQGMAFGGPDALRAIRQVGDASLSIAERLRREVPADALASGRVEPRVTTGIPRREILDVAEEIGADLIVMGVAPRGLLDRALSGSVSRAVASRTHVPLLFVPAVAGIYEWRERSGPVVMHGDLIDPMLAGLAQSRGPRAHTVSGGADG
jgi:nucleotide-binding universal stress UspA family protein